MDSIQYANYVDHMNTNHTLINNSIEYSMINSIMIASYWIWLNENDSQDIFYLLSFEKRKINKIYQFKFLQTSKNIIYPKILATSFPNKNVFVSIFICSLDALIITVMNGEIMIISIFIIIIFLTFKNKLINWNTLIDSIQSSNWIDNDIV